MVEVKYYQEFDYLACAEIKDAATVRKGCKSCKFFEKVCSGMDEATGNARVDRDKLGSLNLVKNASCEPVYASV